MEERQGKVCVIYARYSSHNQTEASIEQQVEECTTFARAEGMVVQHVYADRAISGTTDDRPQFQQMIADSSHHTFQYVVVWKVDRFARDRYDSANYRYRLKKNGVQVLSAKEPIPAGPEGILLESILEGSAEYYSANLSQNVKRGLNHAARDCKALGRVPMGYRIGQDGRWEIDENDAATVRHLFDLLLSGYGFSRTAKELNRSGYTIHGRPWTAPTVSKLAKQKKYIGWYEYNGYVEEGGCPAIIDPETYDRVQTILQSRQQIIRREQSDGTVYMLTGKAFCGKCGCRLVGDGATRYKYYSCSGRIYQGLCDARSIRKEKLEHLICDRLRAFLSDGPIMAQVAGAIERNAAAMVVPSQIGVLKARLQETESAIGNILKAIEGGAWSPSLNRRLADLETELAEIKLAILNEEAKRQPFDRAAVLAYLQTMV